MKLDEVVHSDALEYLKSLPDSSVNCCVTSPPYFGLRDYGVEGQIGREPTPAEFVSTMVTVFREVRRVLRSDGTCWINLGDSYSGTGPGNKKGDFSSSGLNGIKNSPSYQKRLAQGARTAMDKTHVPGFKTKNLMMIPARVAIALCDDGWYLRSEIVWAKPNPMPESVTDRPTKSHEMVYMLTKKAKYWYDADAIMERAIDGDLTSPRGSVGVLGHQNRGDRKVFRGGGKYAQHEDALDNSTPVANAVPGNNNVPNVMRNRRTVWTVTTEQNTLAHFATFPRKLITPMILAGCPVNGVVLDPFMGAGTTALVARSLGRHYIGCDLNPDYVKLANDRLNIPFTLPLPMDVVIDVQLPMFRQELIDAT